MTKDDLHAFAKIGARSKLQEIQELLADYHKEFPDLFISDAAPVFLKGEHGAAPAPAPDQDPAPASPARAIGTASKAYWTPERRAAKSRQMKALAKAKRRAPKAKAATGTRTGRAFPGDASYQALRAYMASHGSARLTELTNAIGAPHPANVLPRLKIGVRRQWFKKTRDGAYVVGPRPIVPDTAAAMNGATAH